MDILQETSLIHSLLRWDFFRDFYLSSFNFYLNFRLQGWDSYRDFRSDHLNMEMSFECRRRSQNTSDCKTGNSSTRDSGSSDNKQSTAETESLTSLASCPTCVFYANTMRWLDNVKTCMAHVGRPIKRGQLFGPRRQKRKNLMRHLK